MKAHPFQRALLAAMSSLVVLPTSADEQENHSETQLKAVNVKASTLGPTTEKSNTYNTGTMSTATKLDLSARETPQSISVITRTQLDDFALNSVTDALQSTVGVTVEQSETDRVYYTSRGFKIINLQVDGVGVALEYDIVDGDRDTALYDRVEVVRGATGLMAGTGNPSATINFVRKRPTQAAQTSVRASAGSWDNYRLDGDIAGAISDHVRGRLVIAQQQKKSYLDYYGQDRTLAYGVIEGDIGAATILSAGISQHTSKANSPMWGSLPLYYSDYTSTDYSVSKSTSTKWSFWDGEELNAFAELMHDFNNGWNIKATYTHTYINENSKLFYMYGLPNPVTESGLKGWASRYDLNIKRDLADLYATGSFTVGKRTHELVVGANWARAKLNDDSIFDNADGFPDIADFGNWTGDIIQPAFTDYSDGSVFTDKQYSIYATTRLHITQTLAALVGARVVNWESVGVSYSVSQAAKERNKFVPYAGAVYDINQTISVYLSYTEIFSPQSEIGPDFKRLAPAEGNSKEIGLKAAFFENRLNASLALFDAENNNVAEQVGMSGTTLLYKGEDSRSRGYELEVVGEVATGWQINAGFTNLTMENAEGSAARSYIPRRLLRASTAYRFAQWQKLRIGAGINWQSATETPSGFAKQNPYMLAKAFAAYDFSEHLDATININNIANKKYINSLMYEQGFYGSPRNINASITWKY